MQLSPVPYSKYLASMVLLASTILPSAAVATAFPLQEFNLLVEGDLITSQEVEGRTFVGGNISGSAFQVAVEFDGPDSETTLSVGGDINVGNLNVNNGSVEFGGQLNSQSVNNNSGGTISQNTGIDIAPVFAELRDASAEFASLESNASFTQLPNRLTFDAAGLERAIFSISDTMLFETSNQFVEVINAESADEVIINVTSADGVVQGANSVSFGGLIGFEGFTLFNLPTVTELSLGTNLRGSLLAPNAALTTTTSIDGAVAVSSFVQNGEVHLPLTTVNRGGAGDNSPNEVPVPSALTLLVAGVVLVFKRRRSSLSAV